MFDQFHIAKYEKPNVYIKITVVVVQSRKFYKPQIQSGNFKVDSCLPMIGSLHTEP